MHRHMLLQSDFGFEALTTLKARIRSIRRMSRIMLVQIRLQGKSLEANPTHMGPLINVYQAMFLKITLRRKPLITQIAVMQRLLIRVGQIMLLEIGLECERLITHVAHMRFLALMNQIMLLEVGLRREIFPADITHVPLRLLWVVDQVMFVQVGLVAEGLVAGVARERLISIMQSNVFEEVRLRCKPFVADLADEWLQLAVGCRAVFVRGLLLHFVAVGLEMFGEIGVFGEGSAAQMTQMGDDC